jgi:hypothetical protein
MGAVLVVHEFVVAVLVLVIIYIILHLQTLGQNAGYRPVPSRLERFHNGLGISMTRGTRPRILSREMVHYAVQVRLPSSASIP